MKDYSELAKKLRERAGCFDYDGRPDIACDYEQAADAIEQLQKDLERSKDFESFWQHEAEEALKNFQVAVSNKPRWIPVTERLPEVENDVLIAVLTNFPNREPIRTVTTDFINTAGQWDGASCDWRHEVTHWMPLPEPPKEETEWLN